MTKFNNITSQFLKHFCLGSTLLLALGACETDKLYTLSEVEENGQVVTTVIENPPSLFTAAVPADIEHKEPLEITPIDPKGLDYPEQPQSNEEGCDDTAAFGVYPIALALPDGNGMMYQTSVHFTEFDEGKILEDVDTILGTCIEIEHSWMRDLEISISCPNGQEMLLHNHPGRIGGETFLGIPNENDEGPFSNGPIAGEGEEYCWTPDPGQRTWINYANDTNVGTLPPGNYAPVDDFETLLGCPLNGEWQIKVWDRWPLDNGHIFSWQMLLDPVLLPETCHD